MILSRKWKYLSTPFNSAKYIYRRIYDKNNNFNCKSILLKLGRFYFNKRSYTINNKIHSIDPSIFQIEKARFTEGPLAKIYQLYSNGEYEEAIALCDDLLNRISEVKLESINFNEFNAGNDIPPDFPMKDFVTLTKDSMEDGALQIKISSLYKLKRYDEALKYTDEFSYKFHESESAIIKGCILLDMGRIDEAAEVFKSSMKKNNDFRCALNYAVCLSLKEDYEGVVNICNYILNMDNEDPLMSSVLENAFGMKMTAEFKLKRYEDALETAENAFKTKISKLKEYIIDLQFQCLIKLGRLIEADSKLEKLYDITNDKLTVLIKRALVLLSLKKYEEIVLVCKMAESFSTSNKKIYELQSAALFELKRFEDVILSCDKGLRIEKDLVFYQRKVFSLQMIGRSDIAIKICEEGLKYFPKCVKLLSLKASLLSNSLSSSELLNIYEQILSIDPNNSIALIGKASCLLKLDRKAEAIKCYEIVSINNPKDKELKMIIAQLYLQLGDARSSAKLIAETMSLEQMSELTGGVIQSPNLKKQ